MAAAAAITGSAAPASAADQVADQRPWSLEPAPPRGEAPRDSWARWLGGVVLIDFLIGFGLLWDRYPLPGLNQPIGVPLLVVGIVVAAWRRPTRRLPTLGLIVALYGFMLGWAVLVSHLNHLNWYQRAAKMTILMVFALAIAQGRLHLRSLLQGLVVAMLVNVPLYYAGLTPDNYPPFLTGFFGDKNIAGMMYATLGVLGLLLHRRWSLRVAHVVVFGAALALTGSRTSMAAMAVALVWLALRNVFPLLMRLGLAAVLVATLATIEAQFSRVLFFRDREGTDWFREQIDLATAAKLALSPWYGDGLTTAWVRMGYRFMYFHNSYSSMRIEGGWVMVAVMLLLFGWFAAGFLMQRKARADELVTEAAMVVVLVCAWKLGEVFFTTPAFLVLGAGLLTRRSVPRPAPASSVTPIAPPRRSS
ncbi:O-antigen ligase family protein [Aestuariimicrobium soli]|uniref:O-antigen ligase family protein n=1 Tax=Aestuariimicrobium soli TaxID=2035834 RepID=UPI003EC0AE09